MKKGLDWPKSESSSEWKTNNIDLAISKGYTFAASSVEEISMLIQKTINSGQKGKLEINIRWI